jgi:hypothetical protein
MEECDVGPAALLLTYCFVLLLLYCCGWRYNRFMVTAILKEQYGISLDEDLSARPSCLSCRRHNITLHLQKIW